MSHEHQRRSDSDVPPRPDFVDVAYKGGKIAAMLVLGGGFLLTVRDRIELIPKHEIRLASLESRQAALVGKMEYLVGGMEALTGKKYRPVTRQGREPTE